ncbi:hypothetical protein DIZ76_015134 [Coccidioides immitis]|nr:hypothetical protein DIZ76_015134 [Coccidioides immitis]
MTIPESGSVWKIGVDQGDKSSDGQRTCGSALSALAIFPFGDEKGHRAEQFQNEIDSTPAPSARKVNQFEVVVCYEDRINPASSLLTANSGRRTLRWLGIRTPAQRHRVELFGESRSPTENQVAD